MAIPDGKPATDFSAMNREWVRAVAAEAAEGGGGGGGIPAPENPSDGDVLTYSSTDSAWVAAAPSGGGGSIMIVNAAPVGSALVLDKTYNEIKTAMAAGTIVIVSTAFSDEGYYSLEHSIASVSEQATAGGGTDYTVFIFAGGQTTNYFTDDPDDYPELAL